MINIERGKSSNKVAGRLGRRTGKTISLLVKEWVIFVISTNCVR